MRLIPVRGWLLRRGALGGRDARTGYWLIGAALPWTLFVGYFALTATIGGGITRSTPLYGLVASVFAIPPRFASADDVRPTPQA